MVTAVTFFSGSGAMGGRTIGQGFATPPLSFSAFAPGATSVGNRVGFFGALGAPSSPVVVGQHQDRSHIVDHLGVNFGFLVNGKFVSSAVAAVSGVNTDVTGADLQDVPSASGTILARFTEPSNQQVTTQNATFRAVALTAASGAPDITSAGEPSNIDIRAFELANTHGDAGDTAWTQIAGGGSNSLGLAAQAGESMVHDFNLMVSVSPSAAGRKIDFGFVVDLEFL